MKKGDIIVYDQRGLFSPYFKDMEVVVRINKIMDNCAWVRVNSNNQNREAWIHYRWFCISTEPDLEYCARMATKKEIKNVIN